MQVSIPNLGVVFPWFVRPIDLIRFVGIVCVRGLMRKSKDLVHEQAHAVDKYVGARVRQKRRELGMSQASLAMRLGLTFQQVQKYERGTNRISSSKLWEAAQALNVTVGWFFEGYPDAKEIPPDPASDVRVFLGTSEGTDLGTAYLALPTDDQRRHLLALMRTIGTGKRA